MTKRLLNLKGLFSNTKFLVVFSIVLALIFWIVVALEYTPIVQNVVEDVPVVIDLKGSTPERLGLTTYGAENLTVNISVEGKRYDVGGKKLTAADFIVEAETAYVDSAGVKALAIKVAPKNVNAEYEIIGLSSDYVNVFFDREFSKDITLTPVISNEKVTADGYEFYEDELIAERRITVSGPKTEVEKIQEAYLNISLDDELSTTTVVDGTISFKTISEDEIKYVKVNGADANTVKLAVTIPVYKIQTLPADVSFIHMPSDNIDEILSYTCTPETVNVAVRQDDDVDVTKLIIGQIDYNEVLNGKTLFTFNSSDIENVKVLDGTQTFKVKIETKNIS